MVNQPLVVRLPLHYSPKKNAFHKLVRCRSLFYKVRPVVYALYSGGRILHPGGGWWLAGCHHHHSDNRIIAVVWAVPVEEGVPRPIPVEQLPHGLP